MRPDNFVDVCRPLLCEHYKLRRDAGAPEVPAEVPALRRHGGITESLVASRQGDRSRFPSKIRSSYLSGSPKRIELTATVANESI
jgi:hypothetical protein